MVSSCKDNTPPIDPLVYDYKLTNELIIVQGELYHLLEIMGTKNKIKINKQLSITRSVIKQSIQDIEQLPSFEGYSQYQNSASKQCKTYLNSLNKYYPSIIRLSLLPDPSQQESDQLDDIFDKLEDIEEPVDDQLTDARKAFCKRYNIKYQGYKND